MAHSSNHWNNSLTTRNCPNCESASTRVLLNAKPVDFCNSNWTYRRNWPEILGAEFQDQCFPIVECIGCGFIFAKILPSPEFLTQVYDEVIDKDIAAKASRDPTDIARRLRYISQSLLLVSRNPAPKALDYGCGFGMTLKLLLAAGVQAIGFDPSELRIESLEHTECVTNSFDDLSTKKPYDLVICDNVLEHLPNPRPTLRRLATLCAPGAILYVSVPAYEKTRIDAIRSGGTSIMSEDMCLNPWEHLNYFCLESLDHMMGDYGFKAIPAASLAGEVDIGLRPEQQLVDRQKNALASLVRLVSYAFTGRAVHSVESRFYRFSGGS